MPADVVAYLAKHHHNHMHLDFHVARMWDRFDASTSGMTDKPSGVTEYAS